MAKVRSGQGSKLAENGREDEGRRYRGLIWTCYAIAFLIAACVGIAGYGHFVDEQARNVRDSLHSRPASGKVHIVEIDASSIALLKSWPWPRRVHGDLVDRLHEAGVTALAFDVDFSATTRPQDDLAFASALDRFGGSVILSTFRQSSGSGSADIVENLPMDALSEHAFLGSVNVDPDRDGQMRSYSYGTVTNHIPRPAIAALLSGTQGKINESFRIDHSIDPASIPRHSYADILNGKVGAGELRGKLVIVGATAIELGDRYAVPLHGVLPGVVVQALAAETLIQGAVNPNFGPWPLLIFATIAAFALMTSRSRIFGNLYTISSLLIILSAPLALEVAKIGSLEMLPALVLIILSWASRSAIDFGGRLHSARFTDVDSGLGNENAMLRSLRSKKATTIIALRISNYGEISAILTTDQRKLLTQRMVDRILLTFGVSKIYQLQPGLLALHVNALDAEVCADRMEAAAAIFRSPVNLDTRQIVVTLAGGLSHYQSGSVGQALANARLAADSASSRGHLWELHNDARLGEADRALQLLADLDQALAREEIHAVFQPKWHIGDNRICGAEALVRWRHPVLGAVAPDEFIPLLEARGRTAELTLHVLDLSLQQLARWDAMGLDIGVAVNLSAPLLIDLGFMARLREVIKAAGSNATRLTLEITESATLSGLDPALEAVRSLKDLGISLSIDDYGTGQSTLTYLKTFSASEIKIDKSFITNMLSSRNDQILVRSTIELAHELGFKVVAEGIEDAPCLALLKLFGCDVGQGWHLGRPMGADEFLGTVLRSRQAPDVTLSAVA